MPDFLPGLTLSARFFRDAVRPILGAHFPEISYSAALIGDGSEVLGFDTPMSTDHDWGPRLLLFLNENDFRRHRQITRTLTAHLPTEFLDYPTAFATTQSGEKMHRVVPTTIRRFFRDYLNFDVRREIRAADWLTFPEQKLRSMIGGAVFHDDLGLQATRSRFTYYPHDVWLYLLAAGWNRIGQEEHLLGRAGSVNDQLGARLIASRLVRDLMRLCFLMERQYAPYAKWFGTGFAQLACAADLTTILQKAQVARTGKTREAALTAAYQQVAAMHNRLQITPPLSPRASRFHQRPYRVIQGGEFAGAILLRIQDAAVQKIAARGLIGSVDQFSDSTDLVADARWRTTLRRLYEERGRVG